MKMNREGAKEVRCLSCLLATYIDNPSFESQPKYWTFCFEVLG